MRVARLKSRHRPDRDDESRPEPPRRSASREGDDRHDARDVDHDSLELEHRLRHVRRPEERQADPGCDESPGGREGSLRARDARRGPDDERDAGRREEADRRPAPARREVAALRRGERRDRNEPEQRGRDPLCPGLSFRPLRRRMRSSHGHRAQWDELFASRNVGRRRRVAVPVAVGRADLRARHDEAELLGRRSSSMRRAPAASRVTTPSSRIDDDRVHACAQRQRVADDRHRRRVDDHDVPVLAFICRSPVQALVDDELAGIGGQRAGGHRPSTGPSVAPRRSRTPIAPATRDRNRRSRSSAIASRASRVSADDLGDAGQRRHAEETMESGRRRSRSTSATRRPPRTERRRDSPTVVDLPSCSTEDEIMIVRCSRRD